MNRFKSWALWTAIAALVVFCLKEWGGDRYQRTGEWLFKRFASGFSRIWYIEQPDRQNEILAAVMLFAKE